MSEEETRKEKRAREEPKPATMKASPQRCGGTHGAAPQREMETPAAIGALEAFNRRFRVHAQTKFPTHETERCSQPNLQGNPKQEVLGTHVGLG